MGSLLRGLHWMGGIIHRKQCPRKKGQRRRSTMHSSSGKKGMWIVRNKKKKSQDDRKGRSWWEKWKRSEAIFPSVGLGISKLIFSSIKFHFPDDTSLCRSHFWSNHSRHLTLPVNSKHGTHGNFGISPTYSQRMLEVSKGNSHLISSCDFATASLLVLATFEGTGWYHHPMATAHMWALMPSPGIWVLQCLSNCQSLTCMYEGHWVQGVQCCPPIFWDYKPSQPMPLWGSGPKCTVRRGLAW